MIIVKLSGGLGNQMFQYAAGFNIANHLKTSLKLDLSFYYQNFNTSNIMARKYELHYFNISAKALSPLETKLISLLLPSDIYFNKYKEESFSFNYSFLKLKNNSYLDGYWQSEKYFSDYKKELKKEFSFIYPISGKLLYDIVNTDVSVSLHIRRSDYITNLKSNKIYNVCSEEYYKNAMELFCKKFDKCNFYIFSDDIAWCRKQSIFKNCFFVEYDNNNAANDLQLMSHCKHQIIANSTFSWWAAWLNANPNKIVISPKIWFKDKNINTNDLIPKSWIQL